MNKLITGLTAIACLGMASATLAAAGSEATLATPVASPTQVVIDGKVWSCEGQKCTAGDSGRSQPPARECARVARQLGEVTAYRSGDKVLDADQIRACNR